jgi:outer membrane protein
MKYLLCASVLFLSVATQAQTGIERYRTDSGFDFYMGAAVWYTNANGSINAPSINYTLALEEDDIGKNYNGVYFTAFEHPIRYLPDIRISHSKIKHEGEGTLTFISVFPIEGNIELSHTDITLYYSPYDGLGFVRVGLTARIFDGELYLNILPSGPASTSDLSTTLGLIYLNTGIHIPNTDLDIGLTINGGSLGDDSSADASLYLQHELPEGLGIQYGYRYFNTEIASKGSISAITIDINADFNIYGPFINFYYHF